MKYSVPSATYYSDEVSLHETASKIWCFYRGFARTLIPVAFMLALATSAGVSLRPVYRVTAILDAPQLSLNEWRTFSPLLVDKALVQASLSTLDGLKDTERDALERNFLTPAFWESRIQYKTALHRDDIKETPNADPRRTDTLGLEISITASDENAAAQRFETIANHIRQTMIRHRLTSYLQDQRQIVARKLDETAIGLIRQQFAVELSEQRIADMQKLLKIYPELRRMDSTTVISVENGGGKYLSPLAQIVALEATISEANASMRAVRREQEEIELRRRFLAEIGTPPQLTGKDLAAWLNDRKKALFASTDQQSQITQEVSHDLDLHLQDPLLYADLWQFKTLPSSFRDPILLRRPLPVGIITFFAVWLLLPPVIVAFRTILRWTASNHQ